ncbi:MAG: hypothetical protein RXQ79_06140 [Acidilobus sp.]
MLSASLDEATRASLELARLAMIDSRLASREGLSDAARALQALSENAMVIAKYLTSGSISAVISRLESSDMRELLAYASPRTAEAYESLRYYLTYLQGLHGSSR